MNVKVCYLLPVFTLMSLLSGCADKPVEETPDSPLHVQKLDKATLKATGSENQALMPVVFTGMLFGQEQETGGKSLGMIKNGISQTPQVILDNQVLEQAGGLSVTWDYVTELFHPDTPGEMFRQYTGILEALVLQPDIDIVLSLLPRHREFVRRCNDTAADFPGQTLHGLFTEQAQRTPDHCALKSGENQLSYRQLDETSNRMARRLKQKHIGHGCLVGILGVRDIYTIVNIIAVLKTVTPKVKTISFRYRSQVLT